MWKRQYLLVFLCLILHSFYVADAQTPAPRWNHGAAFINNKLYIFGGQIGGDQIPLPPTSDTDELWYLDMTQSFQTRSPPWLQGPSGGPQVTSQSVNLGGPQGELMVVFGGDTPNTPRSNPLVYFNTKTSQWISPNLASTSNPSTRLLHTGATLLNDSTVYIYGGQPSNKTTSTDTASYSGLWKLDTNNTIWTSLTDSTTPLGRFHHTSTILNDGKMYVIGGFQNNAMVDMKQIDIYDTYNQVWTTKMATGTVPSARRVHQAVGTPDQKIIIFGGTDVNYTQFYNDLPVLDVSGSTPTWTSPGNGAAPPGRYAHSMTLVGTNAIVAFGYLNSWKTDFNFYVLDTTSYTWTNQYSPNGLPSPPDQNGASPQIPGSTTPSSVPESNKKPLIIGVTVAAIVVVLIALGLLFTRKNNKTKKRKESMIAIPYENITLPSQEMTNLATKIDFPISNTSSPPSNNYRPSYYSVSGSSSGDGLILNPKTTSVISDSSEGSGTSYNLAGRFNFSRPLLSSHQEAGSGNNRTQ